MSHSSLPVAAGQDNGDSGDVLRHGLFIVREKQLKTGPTKSNRAPVENQQTVSFHTFLVSFNENVVLRTS